MSLAQPLLPDVTVAGVKTPRRPLDQYFTPPEFVDLLVDRVPSIARRTVLECCAGQNDIAKRLSNEFGCTTITNDIDIRMPSYYHLDATQRPEWSAMAETWVDWVVSNPPFSHADQIVPLALDNARVGVAMLLRLLWLESVKSRASLLSSDPPDAVLVLPRYSYTRTGKSDSVTSAWMVWYKDEWAEGLRGIRSFSKDSVFPKKGQA